VFITGGYLAGNVGLSQAVVFTLIVIEAVIAGVALVLVVLIKRTWMTLDMVVIAHRIRRGEP
jgi:multisubunit Na+/H+ antiporter MnhC subunit